MIFRIPSIPMMPIIPTLVGGDAGVPIDPAFLVTNGGETVTHNGASVTYGSDIDPALLVTNDGAVVTASAAIVTYGA